MATPGTLWGVTVLGVLCGGGAGLGVLGLELVELSQQPTAHRIVLILSPR